MTTASIKDNAEGISKNHGIFEMGAHSVLWAQQNDGWHIVIQKETNPEGPSMNSMTNHQEPFMAYQEFSRIVKSILSTTSTNEVINTK
mgnify:CR=1 FL=1